MGCFGLRTWTMGTRTGRRPFSFCFHPPSKGSPCQHQQIRPRFSFFASPAASTGSSTRRCTPSIRSPWPRARRSWPLRTPSSTPSSRGWEWPGSCRLPWAADSSESMRCGQRRQFCPPSSASHTSGYGREGTRPRISESEGRPPDSRQAAVFRSRNNIRVPKNERPRRKAGSGSSWSGRRDSNPRIQAWEAWALPLGDARMREANYSAPFPVREETHISTWLIGLPAEDAEGGFSHPLPPDPRRSHYRNTRAD